MRRRVAAQCAVLAAVALVAATTQLALPSPAAGAVTESWDSWPALPEQSVLASTSRPAEPAPGRAPAPPTPPAPPPAPTANGIASTYPGTAGYMGLPVVALPGALGGRYTGAIGGYVTVCADRCARLAAVDWCQCYWGTADQRVVDLSHQAWGMISDQPLSRGLIPVTVIVDDPALIARM